MPSEIGHIVLGKKVYDKLDPKPSWGDFVRGTVFPDIRHLAKLERHVTHIYNTSFDAIPTNNAFKSGFYVHSWLDEKESEIRDKIDTNHLVPDSWEGKTAYKFMQDKVLYSKFDNWDEIVDILKDISPEELTFGADKKIVVTWHRYVSAYVSQGPSLDNWGKMLMAAAVPGEKSANMLNIAGAFLHSPDIEGMITRGYNML